MPMWRLIPLVLLVGCMTTQPDPSRPMPKCGSDAECDAKIQAGLMWLRAHDYKIAQRDGGYAARANAAPYSATVKRDGDQINIVVQCEVDLFAVNCEDMYSIVYDITQVMNATN